MKHLNLIPQSKIRIKKLFIKYKSLKLIPKIGVTILTAVIIGGLVGGVITYGIKSKPVSLNQTKPTTISTNNPQTTQPVKSVGSSTPKSASISGSSTTQYSYCPMSNGQLTINKSGYSCAVLDQGECWPYSQTVNNALFSSVNSLTKTIESSANSTLDQSDPLVPLSQKIADVNQIYTQGNSDLNGLYEEYVQDFKPPYPNCSPMSESTAYTPFTLLTVPSSDSSTGSSTSSP